MIHRGHIVEKIVRKSGYSLTKLAEKLGISRNTLYNRFDNANLGYRFIMDVGNIIHYDFTLDFPEIKKESSLISDYSMAVPKREDRAADLWRIEGKYTHLLEKYTKLLGILVKIANENELHTLKKEIVNLLEKETRG
ncbi:MAG: helix-turn-helix domain-containing protein [Candidatus Amoebophilus sp.]